jgi:hypothetical protein
MITFVAYYVQFKKKVVKEVNQAYKSISLGDDYVPPTTPLKMIQAMFESARQLHPNANMLLITDEETEIFLPEFIKVYRLPRETDYMEIEMVKAKIFALRNLDLEGNVVFLDSDMIVNANLDHIFEQEAHLFFTYLQKCHAPTKLESNIRVLFPINIGFIAVKDQSKKAVADFLEAICEQFPAFKDKKYWYWLGFQYLLLELFGKELMKNEKQGTLESLVFSRRLLKVAFLNANIYNFIVTLERKMLPDAKILHFKGIYVKSQMLTYWKQQQK